MTHQKKHTNIIRINGINYNAYTGLPVGPAPKAAVAQSVDGVISGAHTAKVTLASPRIPAAPQPLVSKVKSPIMDISRSAAPHHKAHAAQPGKTLMRAGLPKPAAGLKRTTKANGTLQNQVPAVLAKQSIHAVDLARSHRAAKVAKSGSVKRFGAPVKDAPPHVAHHKPAITKYHQAKAHSAAKAVLAPTKLDMFERAIANARGHEQPTPKIKTAKSIKSRRTNLASSALAITLLAGFIAYQNVTNIQMQVASSRAGFSAGVPAKRPPGFSVAGVSYQPGAVDMEFTSNSDDRRFAISQKTSAWDSQTLREVYISNAVNDGEYQTVETGGRTVYLYGGNATWVDSGVWYQVTSDGSLSSRQLVELAGSM